jgi:lipoprotein-anchoring transpeptidase ErfK/SrfK
VSSLNFRSGDTVANAVVAPVSVDRAVCVYVYGVADVLVDVSGYVADGFAPVSPTRVVDTRGSSPVGALDGSGVALRVDVSSVVPVGAVAVAANVTVVSAVAPPEGGFVTVFDCGVRPDVSSLNFRSGDTVANAVVAPVSVDRAVCVYVYGVADVLVDVSGSFTDGISPVEPTRVVDTRATPGAAVRGNGVIEVDVLGPLGRAPGTVAAAMVNLTVAETVGGTFGGYASVFPCGATPTTSTVNFPTGRTVAGAALVPLTAQGTVCVHVVGHAEVLLDVNAVVPGTPVAAASPVLPEPVSAGIAAHSAIDSSWERLIVIDPSTSTGYLSDGERVLHTFIVSTGYGGLSGVPGSGGTPPGAHRIEMLARAQPQEILEWRRPTGRFADLAGGGEVTTGLIALDGLEERNRYSWERNVYIHGTNRLSNLGRPGVSGGCIRVHPNDIYFLLDAIEEYPTGVYVLDRPWVRSR